MRFIGNAYIWRIWDVRTGAIPSSFLSLSFPLPLRSWPHKIQQGGLRSTASPAVGLGRSLSRNRIWCIFA